MGALKLLVVLVSLLAVLVPIGYRVVFRPPPVPKLAEVWWGAGDPLKQDKSIRPFKINISDGEIADLKYRLDHHRPFTKPLEGIHQEYGTNTDLLQDIVDYWRTKYNWRKAEKYLNSFEQFKTNIQGLDIHFIRHKPKVTKDVKVLPLILLHGWPGSLREFLEILPILTTPRDGIVFDVVAPHIPGYGFSQPSVRPGLGAAEISLIMKNLMNRLGFEKFYAQGGDFGSIILQHLSVLYPDSVLGFHSNMCVDQSPRAMFLTMLYSVYPAGIVKKEHEHKLYPMGLNFKNSLRETGYLHLQATKPDTIGVAMNESPIGLASYVLEKFVTGYNHTYQVTDFQVWKNHWFGYDELLDNIMIYWFTSSMTTAFRLYSETFRESSYERGIMRIPIPVPSACARFENDFYSADGIIPLLHPNLVQLTDHHGGHFAALQLPEVLAKDLFSAVLKMEVNRLKPK